MPRGAAAVDAPALARPGAPASRVGELLAQARRGLSRLSPQEAATAVAAGALLVDTRTERQRAVQGELPGAVVVDRTVLEWRLDPASPDRIPEAGDPDLRVIVVCRQGYSSSLAAASLQRLGLHRATDVIGGVEAWLAAGLPVHRGPADVRE
jgi:rhodanese-related sulfurtransferase